MAGVLCGEEGHNGKWMEVARSALFFWCWLTSTVKEALGSLPNENE